MANSEDKVVLDEKDLELIKVYFEYCNRAEIFNNEITFNVFTTLVGVGKIKNSEIYQAHDGFFANRNNRQIIKNSAILVSWRNCLKDITLNKIKRYLKIQAQKT
jgi:hypothetical protein